MSMYTAAKSALAVPATMSTIIEVNPPANRLIKIQQLSIEFSGVSATDVPVIVQFCEVTAASAAGTSLTPQPGKDGQVAVASAAKTLPASEGTVTILEEHNVPPSSGLVIQYPLGEQYEVQGAAAAAKGFSIRANRGTGAAINAAATIKFDE
jgi:hypothetical protein